MKIPRYVNKEDKKFLHYCIHRYICNDVEMDENYEKRIDSMVELYQDSNKEYLDNPREWAIAQFIGTTMSNLSKKAAAQYNETIEEIEEEIAEKA